MMLKKSCRRPACSSLEVLLSTVTVVLFAVCVGLVVVSWLALHPGEDLKVLHGNYFYTFSAFNCELNRADHVT